MAQEFEVPAANVMWDSDVDRWLILVDDGVIAGHAETKKEAIRRAKDLDGITRVLAWTKNGSNFDTHRA